MCVRRHTGAPARAGQLLQHSLHTLRWPAVVATWHLVLNGVQPLQPCLLQGPVHPMQWIARLQIMKLNTMSASCTVSACLAGAVSYSITSGAVGRSVSLSAN